MKNNLALVLAVMIVSSPAFASRARLESLGEGKNGSYYVQDSRNMFLNPSQIVKYKKKLFLELGPDTVTTVDQAGNGVSPANSTGAQRGQGGFTNTFGDFTYALYLNNTSDRMINSIVATNATVGSTFIAPDSQVEAFFAGEGNLNWGISLFYAGNETKTGPAQSGAVPAGGATVSMKRTASLFGTRLGVDMNNWQIFSTVGIISNSTVNNSTATVGNSEFKGKVSVDLAASYTMDSMTAFAKFMTFGTEAKHAGTTYDNSNVAYSLGAGWKHDMTKSSTLFTRLEAAYSKSSTTGVATIPDFRFWNVPIVVGAETAALSWLTVRGSISESLVGQMDSFNTRTSLAGTTTVSAGVGLNFGDLTIDGLVATDGVTNPNNGVTGAPSGTHPGAGTAPQSNTSFGFGGNMLTRVAMTYNF